MSEICLDMILAVVPTLRPKVHKSDLLWGLRRAFPEPSDSTLHHTLHHTLLYSTLLYFTLLYSTLLYSKTAIPYYNTIIYPYEMKFLNSNPGNHLSRATTTQKPRAGALPRGRQNFSMAQALLAKTPQTKLNPQGSKVPYVEALGFWGAC